MNINKKRNEVLLMVQDKEAFRKRYMKERQQMLKEQNSLLLDRIKINKKIRKIQQSLNDWDKILLVDYMED
jgi:hypothetical protein